MDGVGGMGGGGVSLDITMSHYCQTQRDLKGTASFTDGGGRQQEGKRASRRECSTAGKCPQCFALSVFCYVTVLFQFY